ncbi:hypothetical protein H072_780 [Dactylellina haptotyla CBS 200.50]|uniref:Aquaporin n=1 Tax=Dactylellina haptotyla (strain CBS 200.50) TaxID=1284197 RepID=S8C0C9_DACHA|nr:hypothetical protein H072_780 [Dactylellina haptotyla CBS 200.50]
MPAAWERFMPAAIKNHLVAATGEFVGTYLFLFMSFCVVQIASGRTQYARQANTPTGGSDPATIVYIAMAFAMSLAVNVWIFFRVSGGMFNPAVTVALVLGCGMPIPRAAICILAQILGSIAAAGVAEAILPGKLSVGTNTGNGITVVQGLFIEMFLTAQLIITIFMLAVEKTKATFLAPLGIGGALFIGHLVGIYYTGASLNPVRSFGPAVVAGHFNHDHWIYWIGPLLGALLAAGFYKLLKFLQYEGGNPEQDIDLSCSEREQAVRLAFTAEQLGIDGKEGSRSNYSRSKDSDVEIGGPRDR